ncbi:mucin-17-like [Penaeus monodon]|uniref:mucin-17-like n=1 Tax=Penaeus monodon TaxID=6687 RepID=UPI0018A77D9F|nr:mucin-17-like [Penaeus monodon]
MCGFTALQPFALCHLALLTSFGRQIWAVWALGVMWAAGARAVPLPHTGLQGGAQQEADPTQASVAGPSGQRLPPSALGKPVDVVRLVHPTLAQGVASLEELGFSGQSQGPDQVDHFGVGSTQGLGGFGSGEFSGAGGFGSGAGGFGSGEFSGAGGFGSGEVFGGGGFPSNGFHNFGFNHPGFHNGFAGSLGFGDPGFASGGAPGFARGGAFGFPHFRGGNFNGFNAVGSFGGFSGRPFSLSTGGFNPAVVSQPTRVIVQTVPVVVDIVNRTHGSLIPHSQQPTAFVAPPPEARTSFGEGFLSPVFGGFQQQVNNVDPFAFPSFFDSQLEGAAGQGNPENSRPGAGADTSQGSSSNSMADLIGMPVSVVATVNRKGAALVDRISEQNAVLSVGPQNQADQSPQDPPLSAEDAVAALVTSADVLGEASVDTSDTISASPATASLDLPTESISLGQSVSVASAAQESSSKPINGDVPQDQPGALAPASGSGKSVDAAEGSHLKTVNESITEEILPIPAALSTFAALGTPPIFRGETNKNLQPLMKKLTSKGAATGSPSVDSGTITPQVHPDNSHLAASSGNIGQVSGQVLTSEQTFPALTEFKVIPMGVVTSSGHTGGAGVDTIASAVTSPGIIQAEVRSLHINNPTSSLAVSVPEKMSVTQMLAQQVKQAMSGLDTSLQVLPVASGGLSGPAVGETAVQDPSAPVVRTGVTDGQDTSLSSVGEQTHTSTNAGTSLSHSAGLTHLPAAPGGSADTSVQGLLGNGDTAAIGVLGSAAVDLAMARGDPSATVQVQGASTSTDTQAPHTPTSATVSQTISDVTSQVASNLEVLAHPGLAIAHGQPVLTGVSVNPIRNQGVAQGQDFPVTGTSAGLSLGNQGSSDKTSGLELSVSTADTATEAERRPDPVSKVPQDMKRLHGMPALNTAVVVSLAAASNVTASGLSNLAASQGLASQQIGDETGPMATSRIGLAPVVASFATGEAINTSPATATLATPLVLNNGPHSFPKDMHINKSVVVPNPRTPTPVTTSQKAPSSPSSAIKVTNFSTCGSLSTTAVTSTNKPPANVKDETQTTSTKSVSASSQLFPDQSTSRPILPAVSPSLQAGSEQLGAKIAIGKSVLSSALGSSASLGASGANGLEKSKTTGTSITTGSIGNAATLTSTGSTVNIETSIAEGSLGKTGQVDPKEPNLPVQNILQPQTVVTDIGTQGTTVQQHTQRNMHTTTPEIGQQASKVIPGIVLALPFNSLFSPSAFQEVSGNSGSATGNFLENFSITSDPNQFVQLLRNFHLAQSRSDGGGKSVETSFVKGLPASDLATSHGQTVLNANTQTTSSLATAAPVTPVPVSSATATLVPFSSAPATPVPVSSAPATLVSVTPVPVSSTPVTQIANKSSTPRSPSSSVSTSRPRVVSVISPSGSITFLSEDQARLTTSLGFGVPLQAAAGNASTDTGLKSIREPPLTKQGNTLKRDLPLTSVRT